jgi:hypothetical protein
VILLGRRDVVDLDVVGLLVWAEGADIVACKPAAADSVRGALAAAFGRAYPLTLRAEPAVIAGIELRTPHAVMCNSWRADLNRISEELERDGDQPGETRGLARTG